MAFTKVFNGARLPHIKEHRIALKKRLERAKKHENATNQKRSLGMPELEFSQDKTKTCLDQRHDENKPNPLAPALKMSYKVQEAKKASVIHKQKVEQEKQLARKEREKAYQIHMQKTRRGQPKLSLQIEQIVKKLGEQRQSKVMK